MSWKEYSQKKVIEPSTLESWAERCRQEGKSIATLNGSFDLLHAGHLYMVYEVAQTADVLLLALNTDRSIQSYKGKDRPIISLPYRMEMVSALAFVDYVTWFDETDPRALLQTVRPDVHVNGEEYGESCIEAELLKNMGTKLHLVKRIPGLATSDIINKVVTCV